MSGLGRARLNGCILSGSLSSGASDADSDGPVTPDNAITTDTITDFVTTDTITDYVIQG